MEKILKKLDGSFTSFFSKFTLILFVWVGVALTIGSFVALVLLPKFGNADDWIFVFIATILLGGVLSTVAGKITKAIWHSAL